MGLDEQGEIARRSDCACPVASPTAVADVDADGIPGEADPGAPCAALRPSPRLPSHTRCQRRCVGEAGIEELAAKPRTTRRDTENFGSRNLSR